MRARQDPGRHDGAANKPRGAGHPSAPDLQGASIAETYARRAIGGDQGSLEWIVTRLSPILEVRARDQLAAGLTAVCEPADIVNTVWERALPKLRSLEARDRGHLQALLGFLNKIQSNLCVDLLRQLLRRKHFARGNKSDDASAATDLLQRLPSDQTSIFSRVARDESYESVIHALTDLAQADRELIFLRALHGVSNAEAARTLGINSNLAAQRYHRALEAVRRRLPAAVFEALST